MENINMNEQVMDEAVKAVADGAKTIGAIPVIGLTIAGTLLVGAIGSTVGKKAVKKFKSMRETKKFADNSECAKDAETVEVEVEDVNDDAE